jgi:endonuclease-8
VPEGDTIFRAARTLHRALAGSVVTSFESVLPALTRVHDDAPITGRTMDRVEAIGKHLLMYFFGDLVLRTHMRMHGSWHIYRHGEPWQRPRSQMRIVIGTDAFEAVGFSIPVAEFLRGSELARHAQLRQLGPDVLAYDFDSAEAARRLRAEGATPVADALLNQRVLAGLGNVYKSEVLFMCRMEPFTAVSALTDAQIATIVETSHRLLRANVSEGLAPMTTYGGYRRTTGRSDPRERLWVYGRAGLPCRRCGTAIRLRKQGDDARLTYWCPACLGVRSLFLHLCPSAGLIAATRGREARWRGMSIAADTRARSKI